MSKASFFLVCAAALALQGCSGSHAPADDAAPRTVLVSRVAWGASPDEVVIGNVRAGNVARVASEQSGRVIQLLAEVGARVERGQPLARLDSSGAALRLDQASAEVRRASALAEERQSNAARVRALHGTGGASDAELQAATAEARSAEAARQAAVAAQALARRDQGEYVLRAPVGGVVASRSAMLGEMLATATPAFEIDGDGTRRIEALVPLATVGRLAVGQTYRFRSPDGEGSARLTGVSARDVGGARIATFEIASGSAAPGASVEIALAAPSARSAAVPLAAITQARAGSPFVLMVGPDNKVRRVDVRILSVHGETAQIEGALEANQLVVAAGGEFVRPGATVRPQFAQR